MDVFPDVTISRFEQLEPGDLFIYLDDRAACFALKTEKPANGDRNEMVLLGPEFPNDISEPTILPWKPATVVSLGKHYTIRLPTDPASWLLQGDRHKAVCLAVCGKDIYVCANGGTSQGHYFACYVELRTGKIVGASLNGITAFTNTWEILLGGSEKAQRSILKYPHAEG
jgi:hypothetical protein